VRVRRLAALGASAALLLIFLLANSPRELTRRVNFLARSASRELATRRLEGSGTAFDRNFFLFLESARRRLPRDTRGLAIFTPRATTESLYLASYQLAPVPVLIDPARVPPRWLGAVYSLSPPPGWRIVARLPGGALVDPP
jgi:hypothetical protein